MKERLAYNVTGTQHVSGNLSVSFPDGVTLTDEKVNQILDGIDNVLKQAFHDRELEFFDTDYYQISEDDRSFTVQVSHLCRGRYREVPSKSCMEASRSLLDGIDLDSPWDQKKYMDVVGDEVLYIIRDFLRDQNAEVSLSFLKESAIDYDDHEEIYEMDEPEI